MSMSQERRARGSQNHLCESTVCVSFIMTIVRLMNQWMVGQHRDQPMSAVSFIFEPFQDSTWKRVGTSPELVLYNRCQDSIISWLAILQLQDSNQVGRSWAGLGLQFFAWWLCHGNSHSRIPLGNELEDRLEAARQGPSNDLHMSRRVFFS